MPKLIQISESTAERLRKIRRSGDTPDATIIELLNLYDDTMRLNIIQETIKNRM